MTSASVSSIASEPRRNRLLPALLGIVAALLLWLLADDYRARLPDLQQRLGLAQRLAGRGPVQSLAQAQADAAAAQRRRAAIEQRLRTADSAQMTRARLGHELRALCATAGAQNCAVRLAEQSRPQDARSTGSTGAAPSATAAGLPPTATLEALGISSNRATVSGIFARNELERLVASLLADRDAYWRINGLSVRGTNFELDVERHSLPDAAAGGRR